MLYYFKKVKTQLKRKEKIWAVYGEGAVTDPMCQKWFAKFLGTTDILAKSLLWGCLMHWKVFSSSPSLYPLEANSGRELTYSKYPNQ